MIEGVVVMLVVVVLLTAGWTLFLIGRFRANDRAGAARPVNMDDERLRVALRCEEVTPLWLGVMEMLDRFEREMVERLGNPDEEREKRLEGLTAVWAVQELRRNLVAARKAAVEEGPPSMCVRR